MKNIITGFSLILLFQVLGTIINKFLVPIIPGSVMGMILLFIALQLRIVKEDVLEDVVAFLMKNMSFFFIAPTVGIIATLPLIGENLAVIALIIVFGTTAVIASVGCVHQWLNSRKK